MQSTFSCGTSGVTCKACPPGASCTNGQCVQVCNAASCPTGCCSNGICLQGRSSFSCGIGGQACLTCPNGQLCPDGVCTANIGDPCQSNSECTGPGIGGFGICKKVTSTGNATYQGGFCTKNCILDAGFTNCPMTSVCLDALQPYGENDPICSPRCTSLMNCRTPGYACYVFNSVATTACWLNPIPALGTDAGLSDAGGNSVGQPCLNDGQCTSPANVFCVQDVIAGIGPTGFVGGYCSTSCNGTPCGPGTTCVGVTGVGGAVTLPLCLRNCANARTGQSNCRNGYVCDGNVGAPVGYCLPRCNNTGSACPTGLVCNTSSGYCT